MEMQRKRSAEMEELSKQEFIAVDESFSRRTEYHTDSESDDDSNIYATNEDFEDEPMSQEDNDNSLRKPSLTMISESHSMTEDNVQSPHSLSSPKNPSDEMGILRAK